MKYKFPLLVCVLIICPCFAAPESNVTPEAAQSVLREYGLETKVLRPKNLLQDVSSRNDGGFLFEFDGTPCIRVILDRDYWVLVARDASKKNNVIAYIFNPKDGQSALNITFGDSLNESSDAELAQAPGFTKISRQESMIANTKIIWRRWSDAEHLHSDCMVNLPVQGASEGRKIKASLQVTANSEARRQSLEKGLASLSLLKTLQSKSGLANNHPVSPIRAFQREIQLDDSFWRLVSENDTSLSWTNDSGLTISLALIPGLDRGLPNPADLTAFRNFYRQEALSSRGGLVEAEPRQLQGISCNLVTMKFPFRSGFSYQTKIITPTIEGKYILQVAADELGTTGMREAVGIIVFMKEQNISDLAAASKDFRRDPYDRKFDSTALFNVCDERKYDQAFKDHPLSRCRAEMERFLGTIVIPDRLKKISQFKVGE